MGYLCVAPGYCVVVRVLYGWWSLCFFFFFNDTATTEIYTLSLHDALPIPIPAISLLPLGRIFRRDQDKRGRRRDDRVQPR